MIALWSDRQNDDRSAGLRIAGSLGLFAGHPADLWLEGSLGCASLASPRSKPRRGWRPAQGNSGRICQFNGWLDNRDELVRALAIARPDLDDSALYLAAVDRWGDTADLKCIGSYCAIVADSDGLRIRLSRSPYEAPPLYFHQGDRLTIAASVPRAIFAAGVQPELNRKRLVHNLLAHYDTQADWYHGLVTVPLGTLAFLSPDGVRRHRFYDPKSYIFGNPHPKDAPEQAKALLDEAADAILAKMARPGILLSGGLDSPLAAAALLRRLPAEARLPSFTFVPCAGWDGRSEPMQIGDETPLVEAFAAMHPRLEPHFFSNEAIKFDHRARDWMLAMGIVPAGMSNMYMYHSLHQAALDSGCDGIVSADLGNFTYSNNGQWAFGEDFRALHWGKLARNLVAPGYDWRSPARRFAAYVAMPMLPPGWRNRLRRWFKQDNKSLLDAVNPMHPALHASPDACDAAGRPIDTFDVTLPRDRLTNVRRFLDFGNECAGDASQAFEQMYGLRRRDISAYRPLVEFCLSLPPSEYLADGVDRRLARRMGEGSLPDAVRTNRKNGRHGADWHVRMSAQRGEISAELQRYRSDPDLAALIDFDRLIGALEDWPEVDPLDTYLSGPVQVGVTRAIWMSRFIRYVDGRND